MPETEATTCLPQSGDKVRIPKGVYVHSTHPEGGRVAKRTQVVTVSHASECGASGHPEVSWAGSGGYWCRTRDWESIESAANQDDTDA